MKKNKFKGSCQRYLETCVRKYVFKTKQQQQKTHIQNKNIFFHEVLAFLVPLPVFTSNGTIDLSSFGPRLCLYVSPFTAGPRDDSDSM